jgi:DNA invertase Pin-like site-specific DNA recombinase
LEVQYLRVSTKTGQTTTSQSVAIAKAAGHAITCTYADEGVSGRKMTRPEFDRMLDALCQFDVLWVYSLSRIGRSAVEVISLIRHLTTPVADGGRGVTIRSVTEAVDSSTPSGRAFVGVLAILAELEADLTRERVLAGLEAARAAGRVGGRRPILTTAQQRQALRLYEAGERPVDIADTLKCGERTVWRAIAAQRRVAA